MEKLIAFLWAALNALFGTLSVIAEIYVEFTKLVLVAPVAAVARVVVKLALRALPLLWIPLRASGGLALRGLCGLARTLGLGVCIVAALYLEILVVLGTELIRALSPVILALWALTQRFVVVPSVRVLLTVAAAFWSGVAVVLALYAEILAMAFIGLARGIARVLLALSKEVALRRAGLVTSWIGRVSVPYRPVTLLDTPTPRRPCVYPGTFRDEHPPYAPRARPIRCAGSRASPGSIPRPAALRARAPP